MLEVESISQLGRMATRVTQTSASPKKYVNTGALKPSKRKPRLLLNVVYMCVFYYLFSLVYFYFSCIVFCFCRPSLCFQSNYTLVSGQTK